MIPLPGREGGSRQWWSYCAVLTALAFATRLCDIQSPPWVAWDETHFGKMASWYINGTYFFDVHPPLGKLLIALAGSLTGYNGTFAFKEPGYLYNETSYVGMRSLCGVMGAAIVPMAFTIVHDLSGSLMASVYASTLMTFDVGLITLSRFILLDPIMLFFMMATAMFTFRAGTCRQLSGKWWLHLFAAGISLGCAISVKYVGVFVALLVGAFTIVDLWSIYCDLARPLTETVKHFCARALCLIATPVCLYVTVFAVHDRIIYRVQDSWGLHGDGWLHSGHQMTLVGNDMFNVSQPQYLAYGSLVTLHSSGSYRTYLHSHNVSYPDSQLPNVSSQLPFPLSHVQSVTGFRLKDGNNFWRIEPFDEEEIPDWQNPHVPPEPVLSGDTVRLVHNTTAASLAVFNRGALLSSTQKLLGARKQTDLKAYQTAFTVEAEALDDEALLEPVGTTFRLFSAAFKCCVYSTAEKLPEWAGNQIEMICSKRTMDEGALWTVQRHINPRLSNVSHHWRQYRPGFVGRLLEVHRIIAATNAKLKPSPDQMRDADQPWMWPILLRGLHFSAIEGHRVYLLGTAPVWCLCLLLLGSSALVMTFVAFHDARSSSSSNSSTLTACNSSRKSSYSDGGSASSGGFSPPLSQKSVQDCDSTTTTKTARATSTPASLSYSSMGSSRIVPSHHAVSPDQECWQTRRRLAGACFWLWLGWLVHYAPFWLMGRILYFHHYFPAFCFSCMLSGVLIDFFLECISRHIGKRAYHGAVYCFILSAVFSFYMFSPLAYGMTGARPKDAGANSTYYNIWWSRTWDL